METGSLWIQLIKMRSYWIREGSRVGTPVRREEDIEKYVGGERPCEGRDRPWSAVLINQEMPRIARSQETRKGSPRQPSEGFGLPAPRLQTSGSQNSERMDLLF